MFIKIKSSNSGEGSGSARRRASARPGVLLSGFAAALFLPLAASSFAQAPPVVATSPLVLNGTFSAGPVVTDACGDLYVFESGGNTGVVEYQPSTGKVTTIAANTQGYTPLGGRAAFYMDRAKQNLYFPDFSNFYTAHFDQVPIVNCVPGAISATFGGNTGNLPTPNYYYGTANAITGDAAGDVFFTTTQSAQTSIFEEAYSAGSYTVSQILSNWPNQINYVASDAAGDIYFADQDATYGTSTLPDATKIYLLKAPYTATPTVFASGFNNIVGLSFDATGNLYVSDSGTGVATAMSAIYEIPLVSGALSAANQFAIASTGVTYPVAVDSFNDIFVSEGTGLTELKPSSAIAPNTALGATAGTFPVDYIFNAAVTPSSITTVAGAGPSTVFTAGGTGGCATGTTYTAATPASTTSTCTVTVSFAPSTAGLATGALLFTSSSGTIVTELSGVGEGAQATVDPGTVTPLNATLKTPAGVAVDNLGNVFVTDSAAGTLTEFPAGANGAGPGAGTLVPTGSLTLNSPEGVAVDSLGDVFIADAGNNRVVELPAVVGKPLGTSAIALPPALDRPMGVAVDLQGDLLIADTGDDDLLFVPNVAGTLNFQAATKNGASLDNPTAVTVDLNGNVFLAEAGGKNDVLEFAAPFTGAGQIKVATSLSDPTSLTTDASGSLFIVNNGTSSILRLPKVNGNFGQQTLAGSTVTSPYGVAIDSAGNLYVTDATDDLVAEIARVEGSLQFGGWNVGTTSTPLTGTVNSSGTQPLQLGSPSYVASGQTAAGFDVTSDGCAGQTLAVGGSCGITANFTPPTTELNAEETLTLQSNGSNGAAVVNLIGTGANEKPSTLALTLTGPTPLAAGEAVTLTATVGTGASTIAPGGSVKFFVGGNQVGTVAVANGQASLTLKGGLPAGKAVAVSANYTGDVINYSGSTASIDVVVATLPDTIGLAFTPASKNAATIYSNPFSINDNAANVVGPAIGLTATLNLSTTILPNGMVTFYSGGTVLGMATPSQATSTSPYTASIDVTAFRAGTTNLVENDSYLATYNDIYAVYGSDTDYAASTSNVLAVNVVGANPTANLANPNTTGATFSITPASATITTPASTSQTSGSTTLSFISYGGWTGYVNFTCSGLPAYAQCAPFPGAPLVSFSTPAVPQPFTTVDFIVNTNVPPLVPTASSTVWWAGGLSALCLLLLRRKAKRQGHLQAARLATLLLAVALGGASMLGFAGCSSSSSSSSITPKGTYTVNVALHAAQLQANSSSTAPNDINLPTFQITLNVQ